MRRLLQLLFLICLVSSTAQAATTKAVLHLPGKTASAGATILAGVELKMKAGWHTYWRNPGESGGTTEIQWELPSGITVGPIQWPVPEKYLYLDAVNYVYHGNVVLLVPLSIAPDIKPGEYAIKGKATWIECEEVCIPGNGSFSGTLTVGNAAPPAPIPDWLTTARSKLPDSGQNVKASVRWDKDEEENSRSIVIEWVGGGASANPDFYPYENDSFDVLPKTEVVKNEGRTVHLRKIIKKFKGEWPEKISGLLVEDSSQGQDAKAYTVELSFGKKTSAAAIPATGSGAVTMEQESLLKMLLFAFLGGLILNVMPCVLPVIALKVLGFVQQSREEPARVKKLGFIYMLGVLFSFAVFAMFVIGVKAAGSTASWGMHMQNPYFRMLMTVLMFLVALNLFGVFEVMLGGRAAGAAANLSSKSGSVGTFFNGMLAVALGASCTAPILVSAIGYAIPRSHGIILLFFLTIGFGMAFPYLLLSWRPDWIKFLPKPGAWMEKFKMAMGFPVLATALWLFSMTTRSFGKEAVWGFGLFLLTIAISAWIWGQFIQRGAKRKGLAFAVMLAIAAFGYWYGLEDRMEWRSRPQSASGAPGNLISSKGIDWHPWSREAIAKFRAEGHPVLVDFTADWCPNCKSNKRRAIEIDSVRAALKRTGTIAMIADFTDQSPDMAKDLEKYKRSAVPLVLVYPRNLSEEAIVLPTRLTEEIVLQALDKAAK